MPERVFNEQLLVLARDSRGMTQADLASNSGVTQAYISKLENRLIDKPSDETVQLLAKALGYQEAFFYNDERRQALPPFHHRKRSRLSKRTLSRIEALVDIDRMRAERLFRSYEEEPVWNLPTYGRQGITCSPEEAARHLREAWRVAKGPIGNLTRLVQEAGVVVIELDFQTTDWDGVSSRYKGTPPIVFLNSRTPGDRRRFTLAHEIGHLMLHDGQKDVGVYKSDAEKESEANDFAAEFLAPAREIKRYLMYPKLDKLARTKVYWGVSIKALIYRCKTLNLVTDWQYKRLLINYNKAGYNRAEPFPLVQEKSAGLSSVIRYHLQKLKYSKEDLASLLWIYNLEDLKELYEHGPSLQLVKG
ncbi:MAG: XRE family transcriptional regulator [Pseudomonadota bacterium]